MAMPASPRLHCTLQVERLMSRFHNAGFNFIFGQPSINPLRCRIAAAAMHLAAASAEPEIFQYSRLRLQPEAQLPPRVEHLLIEETGLATDLLSKYLSVPPLYVRDLIDFGAVYHARIPPPPPSNLPGPAAERYQAFLAAFQSWHLGAKPDTNGSGSQEAEPLTKTTLKEGQTVRKLMSPDALLPQGSYIRVHVHPRRFPRCYSVNWNDRILAETDSFVVVDKPSGVPVGCTVDNKLESCESCVARALGTPGALRLTHQLDICTQGWSRTLGSPGAVRLTHQLDIWTQGCVVLAKSKEFASCFNTKLKDRQVHKLYRVLSSGARPEEGRHVHFMLPSRFPPRIVGPYDIPGWQRCELEVLEVNRVDPIPQQVLREADLAESQWPDAATPLFESSIALITGRTHQIRAQFAHMGSPVVGDTMYAVPYARDASTSHAGFNTSQASSPLDRNVTIDAAVTAADSSIITDVTGNGAAGGDRDERSTGARLGPASLYEWLSSPGFMGAEGPPRDEGDMLQEVRLTYGSGPDGSIGLQAFQIQWDQFLFRAGQPWWRNDKD